MHVETRFPAQFKLSRLVFSFIFVSVVILSVAQHVFAADSTAPTTSHSMTGTLGQNNWYRSNINVTLTANDAGSGPDTTTYWVDSAIPTVIDHVVGSAPAFQNNSFEQGSFNNITKWFAGPGGPILYYQSNVSPYQGNRSAALGFIGSSGTFYYWHNEQQAVQFPVGQLIEVSAWVRTVMGGDDRAYFEVWGQANNGSGDQLLATSNLAAGFDWDWRNVTAQFTVPSGKDYIYVKMGAVGTPAALVYWDYVETRQVNTSAQTSFTYTTEGAHTLHYYSKDNAGNTETQHTTALNKDTVAPNPWQNFASQNTGCAVCYTPSAEIRDATSGANVSSAQYRYYTKYNNQFWSNWSNVSSVNVVSSGAAAGNGQTGFVTLNAPEVDFGDNAGRPFRVQFRFADQAGNSIDSPVYEIASPWIKATGSIFVDGEIAIPYPPTGENHSDAEAFSNTDIITFANDPNWYDETYTHAQTGATSIADLIPTYIEIKASAIGLPGGSLPTTNGIYIVNGDFDIKNETIPAGYDSATVSAVVIITGDLSVMADSIAAAGNNTVFLVEGNISVLPNVEDLAGYFITQGQFDSDSSGHSHSPLSVVGGVVALDGYILPRDLGDNGTPDNLDTPAEKFTWKPNILLDKTLVGYLNNNATEYIWNEVEK